MARKKMGEILVENEIISQGDLDQALQKQKETNKPIGKILEEMEVILEEDIAKTISTQFGFPLLKRFSRHRFPQQVLDKIDTESALAHLIFPLKIDNKTLYLAMSNPLDMALQSDLSFKLAMRISPCVATPSEIKMAIKKHYLMNVPTYNRGKNQNILVVGNQGSEPDMLEAALKKEGYSIYRAQNGAEGLQIAIQLQPHLIITDMVMPRMDGTEMFEALQANDEIEGIPVIALSANTSAEEEYNLLEMGFFDFIAKPVNPIRLVARVRRAFRQLEQNNRSET